MSKAPEALPWSAVTGEEVPSAMNYGSAIFDLAEDEHRTKYNTLMGMTRNVVAGSHKTPTVEIKDYSGKWVADGRYFVMVQWFQVGDPMRHVPDKAPSPVRTAQNGEF